VGYKTNGVEFESGMSFGNLGINLNAVYSDEVQTSNLGDPGMVGKTSGGVPKWRFNISPRYAFGDAVVGAVLRGQSKVFADNSNTTTIDGHYIVNAFANYDFGKGLIGSVNVNNLFNKIYPTAGGGFIAGSTTVFGAGVNTGRTMSASLRYKF
jgi:outer membrane receptor protein involved in Fe transport